MRCAFAALLLLIAGCDDPSPAAGTLPPPVYGTATVTGVVRFAGDPPVLRMIDTSACHPGAPAYQEETIVVRKGNGLRDVVVYLKGMPASDGSTQPVAKIDQINCRYVPHVLAVQVNQPVDVLTSDPVFHNVHWVSNRNGDVNLNMPAGSAAQRVTFKAPEYVSLRCDVHPWMGATVAVMDHPFFAVTVEDGSFTIPRVPAGKYTLATWHALLGERQQEIEVADDGTVTASFEYAPPTR